MPERTHIGTLLTVPVGLSLPTVSAKKLDLSVKPSGTLQTSHSPLTIPSVLIKLMKRKKESPNIYWISEPRNHAKIK